MFVNAVLAAMDERDGPSSGLPRFDNTARYVSETNMVTTISGRCVQCTILGTQLRYS